MDLKKNTQSKESEEHWVVYHNKKYVLYPDEHSMNSTQLTSNFCSGQVRQLFSCPFAQIKYSEIRFCDSICGGANFTMPHITLYFCLTGELLLEENELVADSANFLAFNSASLRRVRFQPNLCHQIITVEIYPDKLCNFAHDHLQRAMLRSFPAHSAAFFTHRLSPVMKTVLHQLVNCPYHGSVKTIYMEGKLLEILAVYLNEILYQTESSPDHCANLSLSRQDIKSIYQAKQQLDQSFVSPPTLATLSKQICLNEFKLKNGFKQLFGQTVHTYVVDKRLELARLLLEQKKLNVGEAASHIGYSNASYFALAFRKKFGVSPSEYLAKNK
ncbi:helix-turn-helix domain-containing protein [Anaerospora hongkongensis]|uniref:helix-turn-helix domain-containing protein n=1 Tax=Anaerospora hongkongensis TaxID=244830 RepID=UPI002896CC02|nr:AraC family transcriptional regulator [Anaerospora hongkongensis]